MEVMCHAFIFMALDVLTLLASHPVTQLMDRELNFHISDLDMVMKEKIPAHPGSQILVIQTLAIGF